MYGGNDGTFDLIMIYYIRSCRSTSLLLTLPISYILGRCHIKSFHNTVVSLLKNYNGTVHFQQEIVNDSANNISTSQIFTFMISRTVRIKLDRQVTRGLVPACISVSHAAGYVVNTCVY